MTTGEVKFLRHSDGTTVTQGIPLNASIYKLDVYSSDAAFEAVYTPSGSEIYFNSTTNTARIYAEGSWNEVIDSSNILFSTSVSNAGSSTDNAVPKFDGASGIIVQNSGVLVDDSDNITGAANVTITGDIDKSSGAALSVGGTNATNVNIGRVGQTANIKGDAVIDGNLTVSGTTTTVNTDTLDVEDPNITVNKNGNDATSEGAGITIERVGTDGSIVYEDALTSKFKAGALASESEIMTVASAQTITGIKKNDQAIHAKEITTPSNPDAGYRSIYPKADGKFYHLDDGGFEQELGGGAGGSGSGELNYISNPSGALDVTGWTESTDGQVDVDRTVTVSELPRENLTGSGIRIIGTGSTGTNEYVAFAFALDDADVSNKLKISFSKKDLSGYVSGELEVVVYDVTNATTLIPSTSSIANGTGSFLTSFDSTTSLSYELRIRKPLAAVTAGIVISDVIVGPGSIVTGAIVGPWTSWTPGASGWENEGSISAESWLYRRVGDSMEIEGSTTFSGSGSASDLGLIIPEGLTFDTSTLSVGFKGQALGVFYWFESGVAEHIYTPYMGDTKTVYFRNSSGSPIDGDTISTDDILRLHITIPIAEWAGSGTVNLGANDVEYAYNSSVADANDIVSFAYGSGGVGFGSYTSSLRKRVRFQTTIQATDRIVVELLGSGGTWMPVADTAYRNKIASFQYQNTVDYGIGLDTTVANTTDVDVRFGLYSGASGATYGSAGDAWSTIPATSRWRVVKHRSGIPVGFGQATATASGLYKAGSAPGQTTGVAIAAGYVGEIISDTLSDQSLVTNVHKDAGDITLTPGVWQIYARLFINGGNNLGETQTTISETSATADLQYAADNPTSNSSSDNTDTTGLNFRTVNISSSTQYYLTCRAIFVSGSVSTLASRSEFYAVRIA